MGVGEWGNPSFSILLFSKLSALRILNRINYHVFNESELQKLARRLHHSLVTEPSWQKIVSTLGKQFSSQESVEWPCARNCYKVASLQQVPGLPSGCYYQEHTSLP